MARIDLPESRLRLRKRRRRVRTTVGLLVSSLFWWSSAVGLTYLPALQINTVVVSGAQTVSSSTIEQFVRERLAGQYGHILPKSDIFLYPKRDISAALKAEYPLLASAEVYAVDFHTIAVALVERSPRALWC